MTTADTDDRVVRSHSSTVAAALLTRGVDVLARHAHHEGREVGS